MGVWCDNKEKSDITILNAEKNDPNHRKAIKFKVEKNLWLNSQQIDILDYYLTTRGGLIAWIKLDPCMITEIHRRAAKAALKDFRTTPYIPKIACDRKTSVDKLLMECKRENQDFHYIIRNSEEDIKVMDRRMSGNRKCIGA